MHISTRAAVAALLFVSLPAFAQVTQLARGFVATAEQRVAPARPGAVEADDQRLVGIVPASDGLTALSWRSCCGGISPRVQTLHSVFVDRAGRPDATTERQLTTTTAPSIVRSSGLRMVTWTAGGSLRISTLKPDGTLDNPEGKVLTTFAGAPAAQRSQAQCTPDVCLVTWEFSQGIAYIVNAAGNIVERVSILQDAQVIAADDAGFLLFRANDSESRVVRLDPHGAETFHTVLREERVNGAHADFDGVAYYVAFVDPYAGNIVTVQRVALDGTLGTQRDIYEIQPTDVFSGFDIGANGSDHLIAISTNNNLLGIIINSDFTVPRRAFPLTSDTDAFNIEPLVAKNGNDFFVAWEHGPIGGSTVTKILGANVDPLGRTPKPAVLWHSGAAAQIPASIAASASQAVAVWTESDVNTDNTLIRAARVSPAGNGAPLDLGSARVVGSIDSASIGNDVLITWLTSSTANAAPSELHGAIVHGDGFLQQLSLGSVNLRETSVASDGVSWLVAGIDANGQVRGFRIAQSGFVLTPQPTLLLARNAHAPVVASNGNGFLVAASVAGNGIFAVPVRPDGTAAGSERLVSSSTSLFDLASNGRDYLLAVATNGITTTLLRDDASIAVASSQIAAASSLTRIGVAPMGSGFIVLWTGSTGSFAVRTNSSGNFTEVPFATDDVAAFASKSSSSLAALFAKSIDGATATIYRELTEQEALRSRRRIAGH